MGSFNSHNFSERGDGGLFFPAKTREQQIEVRHIPGGNKNVIQDGGRQAEQIELEIYCTTAELSALYGDVGSSASLVYSYETRTAYLRSITDAREIKSLGKYFAKLTFVGQ